LRILERAGWLELRVEGPSVRLHRPSGREVRAAVGGRETLTKIGRIRPERSSKVVRLYPRQSGSALGFSGKEDKNACHPRENGPGPASPEERRGMDKQEFIERYRLRPTTDSQDTSRYLRQERFRAGANAQLEAVWPLVEQLQRRVEEENEWSCNVLKANLKLQALIDVRRAVIEEAISILQDTSKRPDECCLEALALLDKAKEAL